MQTLGLPYMGGKRKIAKDIVDFIMKENPNMNVVYDLFGGGASISFEFLSRGVSVFYNEKDASICELLKHLGKYGISDDFYYWYTREEFNSLKNNNDYLAGFIKSVWSFGNNGRDYLYSEKNAELKKPLHNLVVWQLDDDYLEAEKVLGINIPRDIFGGEKDIQKRRLIILRHIKKEKGRCDLQRLQHLERLQHLQHHNLLFISNQSYDEVEIPRDAIIYLDPPYQNTSRYNNSIDFDKLKEFILKSPNKIYMSEYACDYMREVYSIEKRVTLSKYRNKLKKVEKLFTNQ